MADLSAVLRKTIDGLPKASPDMRAKVYEKARSAIERQIAAASPPLSESVVEARRSALADAIDRTEDHYLERDADEAPPKPAAPVLPRPPTGGQALPKVEREAPAAPPPVRATPAPMPSRAQLPPSQAVPPPSAQKPSWPKAEVGETGELRRAGSGAMPPGGQRETEKGDQPAAGRAEQARTPAKEGAAAGKAKSGERQEPSADILKPQRPYDRTEPDSGLDAIPAADIAAPRYANGRRVAPAERSKTPIFVGLAVLLLGGGAALAYAYQNQIGALLTAPSGDATQVATTTPETPAATTAPAASATQAAPDAAPGTAEQPATGDSEQIAALTPGGSEAAAPQTPKRRFTQRLLADGTEVDEGPGTPDANAFGEGTNIAAASPPDTSATLAPAPVPGTQAAVPAESTPAPADTAAPSTSQTRAAALPPATVAGAPAVAQKAVFYEERTESEQGSQQAGNVVWSVVNESPSEGQPPEPAIRAVTDIPDKNITLTMTIRRNADPTLPASHVIELMFDVPDDFAGGQIANVQRLALKPTEEARGEPLIGVAGKISDGFFIIALNNLDQATKSNLDLMGKEEWIDIPIAYATGRRALISIDKGIPGERAFKQAMDAWAAKT